MCSKGCQFRCRFTPLGSPSESRNVLFDWTLVRDSRSQIMATNAAQMTTALTASANVGRGPLVMAWRGVVVTISFLVFVVEVHWNSGTYEPDGSSMRTGGSVAVSL